MHRNMGFWRGVTPERVGGYLKDLLELEKELDEYRIRTPLEPNKDLKEDIKRAVVDEIKYCRFYFEYRKRTKEADFSTWIFQAREEINKEETDDWKKVGENISRWRKSTGKMKAIIEIDTSEIRTKISLKLDNDSKCLTFYEGRYGQPRDICYKHLSKKQKIEEYIECLKNEVDVLHIPEHAFPNCLAERKNFMCLKELLHIGE